MFWTNRNNEVPNEGVGSPGQRVHHAMAYDSDRGVTVLFGGEFGLNPSGGSSGSGYLDDTWEYDGTNQWRKINTPVHPNARSYHSMAYDPVCKCVRMYGGFGGGVYGLDDTWEYTSDGFNGTWTLVAGDPSNEGLVGTAMVWDRNLGAVVRVGGDSNPFSGNPVLGFEGYTDKLVGTNWSLLVSGSGPGYGGPTGTGYWGLGAAWDSARGDLVALGGYNDSLTDGGSAQGSVWDFLPTLNWQLDTPISPRAYPAVAYDELRNHVVVVGGDNGQAGTGNGVFEYNTAGSSWVSLPAIPPNPINGADSGRAGAAMVYDSRRHVFVLMGGAGAGAEVQVPGDVIRGSGSRFSDTWELVPEQVTIDSQPQDTNANPCMPVSLSVQAHGNGTVTYQWRLDGAPLTGSQYYLGVNSNQLQIQPVLFSLGGNYDVVMGDDCGAQSYVTSRVAKLTVNPGPQWVLRTTNGPGPRGVAPNGGAAMAYDSQRHVTVLFGGNGLVGTNFVAQNDLWEWDGTVWTLRMPNALTNSWGKDQRGYWFPRYDTGQPVPRGGHSMAYDNSLGGVVLYGGITSDPQGFEVVLADTWAWDGTSWKLLSTNGPPEGSFPMAYDSDIGQIVLYRGMEYGIWEGGPSDGFWNWNLQSSTNGPSINFSQGAVMAFDSIRHYVLFGPTGDGILPQEYFWSFDGLNLKFVGNWVGIGTFGYSGAMVYDSNRRRDIFFGGRGGLNNSYANNTTAAWDGNGWSVTPGTDQTSLFSPGDVLNPLSLASKLQNQADPVSKFIWTNLSAATQQTLSDPTATAAEQQTNLATALNAILQGNSIYNTDRFAGVPLSTETQVLIPIFLYGADLIRFNRLLLEAAYPEIGRSPSAPSTRFGHAMAYDSQRHSVVLQGGQNSNGGLGFVGNETWELLAVDSPIINQQPASQVHGLGDTALFSVVAISPAGTSLRYEWFKGNQALADGGRISGSTSPQLQITGVTASDADLYSVSIACDCGSVTSLPAILTFNPSLQEVNAGGTLTLVWAAPASFSLQQANNVTGPWTSVPGATGPFRISVGSGTRFFRLNNTGP